MTEFFSKLPWYFKVAAGVILIVIVVFLFGQIQSCNYDRARKEYEAEKQAWTDERSKLIASALEKERRIQELEPQIVAFRAAAEEGRKLDALAADKIEAIGKQAAESEARAILPTDCTTRAIRVCELLKANRIPADCQRIVQETCAMP